MASVTYNSRTFRINDKPFLILSGSVHYIRVHPSRWSDLFQTFIDAKLNTVETYVFWSVHEPQPSAEIALPATLPRPSAQDYDFSGRRDLFGFIAAAQKHGLRVILRLGPYVCAEVSYGGFPFRLRDVPDIAFRTWNEPFMAEVETWVRHIATELRSRKLLAPLGGPVILFQLENEYSMVSSAYGDAGMRYLQWVADLQKKLDLGVPAIMCYGAAEGVVETINAFYAHKHLDDFRDRHPDQPPVWTECWTGWYDVWGAPHHKRSATELAYAVARFFAASGAGVNYYMWMGGTNWGREPMYLQKSSYDYDAPIDEYYRRTVKSAHLAALHAVLLAYFVPAIDAGSLKKYNLDEDRTISCFEWKNTCTFYCNDSVQPVPLSIDGLSSPAILSARSVQVRKIDTNELLFDTATLPSFTPAAPPTLITANSWIWSGAVEPVPTASTADAVAARSKGARVVTRASEPPEQLRLTLDSSDYCFYTANFTQERDAEEVILEFDAADVVTVFIDGVYASRTQNLPWEDRFSNKWTSHKDGDPALSQRISVRGKTLGEQMCVTIKVGALGLVKGDWQLGGRMERERKGLLSDVRTNGVLRRVGDWMALPKTHGESAGFPRGKFKGIDGKPGAGMPHWWRTVVQVPRADSWVLDLSGMGKGLFWVNGVLIGRYWNIVGERPRNGFLDGSPVVQVERGSPCQTEYHVPGWVMAEGESELVIVIYEEYGTVPENGRSLLKVVQGN